MAQQPREGSDETGKPAGGSRAAGTTAAKDPARNNQENELEAEQESAAAMNADVPHPPDDAQTTEGQPS